MLGTLERARPSIFLEMHGATPEEKSENARRVISLLRDVGYPTIRHVESGTVVERGDENRAAEGHLFCEATA